MTEVYLIISSIMIIFVVLIFSRNLIQQIWLLFSVVGIIMYAGVGISLPDVPDSYLFHISIFVVCYVLTFITVSEKKLKDSSNMLELTSIKLLSLELISKIGFIIYLLSILFFLIYPEFRLHYLIIPPNFTITGVLHRINFYNSFTLLYWVRIIGNLFYPFFWIHLYYIKKRKGIFPVIILLLIELYLKALKFEYIGRTDIMMTILIILIIMLYRDNKKFKVSQLTLIGFSVILTIPFFVSYIYTRMGSSFQNISFFDSIKLFIQTELYYPIYYEFIIHNISINPLKYLIWLLTLPIPKIFTPFIDVVQINTFFSIMVSGINPSEIDFAIYLPSILGEAFIVWGNIFFWIHAIILGLVSGISYNILVKYKQLHFYSFYFIFRSLAMGRGGSQGYISTIINGSLLLIVYVLFLKITYRRKNSKG